MILVDTSVWVDHLRHSNSELAGLLQQSQVVIHPFVVGELALGNLQQRHNVLAALQNLPAATVATDAEVLGLVERDALHGIGIGYIDAHLLASARLSANCKLWTLDKRLHVAAAGLGVSHSVKLIQASWQSARFPKLS